MEQKRFTDLLPKSLFHGGAADLPWLGLIVSTVVMVVVESRRNI
jgi:hypothetical protein